MTKTLQKALVANVRAHNVLSGYSAKTGWHTPEYHTCELCGATWAPGKREAHAKTCLLSRAYKALGQRAPIVKRKAL